MAYEKAALEKAILDIAERQLFRAGYRRLNLNDIAQEAAVSKVTLYKLFESKHALAVRVVDRLLSEADEQVSALLGSKMPLGEKMERCIGLISNLYLKMDRDFLYDLEHSLPELWQRIDELRSSRERLIARLLSEAQLDGSLRGELDAELLAALLMALVRGVYNPAFFLAHNISAEAAGKLITDVFMHGTSK